MFVGLLYTTADADHLGGDDGVSKLLHGNVAPRHARSRPTEVDGLHSLPATTHKVTPQGHACIGQSKQTIQNNIKSIYKQQKSHGNIRK